MKSFQSWFRILGVLLFAYILWTTDWAKVLDVVRGLNWWLVVLATATFFPVVMAKAWRWQSLLRMQGIRLGFGTAYHAYFASLYLGNVTPGRAGDFIKVFYLTQECKVSLGKGFSSVLIDRFFDLFVLLLLGLVGVLLYHTSDQMVTLVMVSFVVLMAGSGVLLSRRLSQPLFRLLFERSFFKRFHGKAAQQMEDFYEGVQALKKPALAVPFLLSVLSYVFFFALCYFLALAMSIPISLPYLVLAITIVNVISIVPVSVMGVGTRDWCLIQLFAIKGISAAVALTYSMLLLIVLGLIASGLGAWSWFHHPLSLKDTGDEAA